jgi:hypothetical protein
MDYIVKLVIYVNELIDYVIINLITVALLLTLIYIIYVMFSKLYLDLKYMDEKEFFEEYIIYTYYFYIISTIYILLYAVILNL